MIMMVRMPAIALLVLSFATLSPSVRAELTLGVEPLSDLELAEYRGGFLMDSLEISIGLEQIVGINGDTLVINRLTIPNLNQNVNGGLVDSQMDTVLEVVSANRIGGARVSSNMAGPNGWMTIVQNSLDSTVIQNMHQLNIELKNVGAGNQFPARLSDQLVQLLGR
ncbi:hypothetical protein [Marinobacter sp. SS8-8]|uniref:hypothetical protein n=1 Tax=Marinobacter sp. SS8-8 TaxID=3050452 RepID=UPI0026DEBE61|nr:hypothetical protein [Marinobacter sp. SS8-8]|tara:strand:+ start:896 stop:1393 length:498 start_codon:yes stop_codon:yes gene_type:complete